MEYTKNYKLPQWVETDRIQMEDFNQAMVGIDAGLESKAENAALAELRQDLVENNIALAAVSAALGSGGENCRIAWGSYIGAGKYGAASPVTLSPGFYPVLALVGCANSASANSWPSIFIRDCSVAHADFDSNRLVVQWSATSVSWYVEKDTTSLPGYAQNNASGYAYYYCVIGYNS